MKKKGGAVSLFGGEQKKGRVFGKRRGREKVSMKNFEKTFLTSREGGREKRGIYEKGVGLTEQKKGGILLKKRYSHQQHRGALP